MLAHASPTQALLAVPGFDAAPALRAWPPRRRRAPGPAFAFDERRTTRSPRRARLGAARRPARRATARRRSAPASPPCPRRGGRPPCSASPSTKTSRSSTAPARRSPGSRSACRRAGRRRRRSAGTSPRCTRRSPTTQLLIAASDQLARLVTGSERWERFVWTISRRPAPAPASGAAARSTGPKRADAEALAAHRLPAHEHQTFIPVAGTGQAVFTIHVDSEPLDAALRSRDDAARLHDALASMTAGGARLPRPDARARPPARGAAPPHATRCRRRREDRADRPRPARARRRRRAALARVRRRLPPAPGRPGPGAPRLPRRQRAAGALARPRALRRARDRLRPRQQLPRDLGGLARRSASAATRLHFISIEAPPLRAPTSRAEPRRRALAPLAAAARRGLAAAHAATCTASRFEDGRVQLLLAFGDVGDWLPQLVAPRRRLLPRRLRAGAQSADVGSRACSRRWRGSPRPTRRPRPGRSRAPVRDGLAAAGFEVASASGQRRQARDHASPASRRASRRAPSPRQRLAIEAASTPPAHALPVVIVGGGLAGCALACGAGRARLAHRRCSSAAPRSPQEGSGNAAGLFHGIVHGHDGHHARFHRAAALEARRGRRRGDRRGTALRGSAAGLLRLASRGTRCRRDAGACSTGSACRRTTCRRSMSATEAERASPASAVAAPAWFFPAAAGSSRAAWPALMPSAPAQRAGRRTASATVAAIRRAAGRWQLLDAPGGVHRDAPTSSSSPTPATRSRLLGGDAGRSAAESRPDQRHRRPRAGRRPRRCACRSPAPATCCRALDGTRWFGASSHEGDADPGAARRRPPRQPRPPGRRCWPSRRRWPRSASSPAASAGAGRAADRLPLIGAVPLAPSAQRWASSRRRASPRPDQPRFVAAGAGALRVRGARVRAASPASALGAQVLAASITGAPLPLEADLLDAIDPARFVSRAFRRDEAARRAPRG